MLTQAQFDQLRAEILLERAQQGGAPLDNESVESAVVDALGQQGVEGFFPSITDHFMAGYVANIAREADS